MFQKARRFKSEKNRTKKAITLAKTDFKIIVPTDVVAVIDPREQLPYDLFPLRAQPGTLQTGDYSVKGLEEIISVERKSLQDFVACCGFERERFNREMHRLRAYESHALVIESSLEEILKGGWKSKIHPNSVYGSAVGLIASGINLVFCGSRQRAQHFTASFLFTCARRRWEELQKFAPDLRITREPA